MELTVDVWSDIACPWCFVGKRRLEKALESAIGTSRNETGDRFAVIYVDFDGFKSVNDMHGHHVGDALLASIGSRIAELLQERIACRAELGPRGLQRTRAPVGSPKLDNSNRGFELPLSNTIFSVTSFLNDFELCIF